MIQQGQPDQPLASLARHQKKQNAAILWADMQEAYGNIQRGQAATLGGRSRRPPPPITPDELSVSEQDIFGSSRPSTSAGSSSTSRRRKNQFLLAPLKSEASTPSSMAKELMNFLEEHKDRPATGSSMRRTASAPNGLFGL
mmetsp:Transcript_136525/g.235780  ORF Transcript_136525/g.235780 Transcript_136525/m.235780 type:complete len:141 (+) Transcript_136525:2-424(+)